MLIFTPENLQLLARAAVPPIFVEVKCPVPTSNISYFFMAVPDFFSQSKAFFAVCQQFLLCRTFNPVPKGSCYCFGPVEKKNY